MQEDYFYKKYLAKHLEWIRHEVAYSMPLISCSFTAAQTTPCFYNVPLSTHSGFFVFNQKTNWNFKDMIFIHYMNYLKKKKNYIRIEVYTCTSSVVI